MAEQSPQTIRIMTDGDVFWVEEYRSYCFGLLKMWSRGMVHDVYTNEFAAQREVDRRMKLHAPIEVTRAR